MKRTFGRFMSLLLVFAMVLAMVPAVFAADTITSFTGETKYVAPGKSITIDYETEEENAKDPRNGYAYADKSQIIAWECSNPDRFEVTNPQKTGSETGKDKTKAIVTHRTAGGTGSATITAYYKDSNGKQQAAAKWTVTVSNYSLTFTPSTLNSTSASKPYALSANSYVDLGVEVEGPSGWVSDLAVKFTTQDKTVAYVGSNKTVNNCVETLYMGNSKTTGTASVRVSAGTGSDIISIKAELLRPYTVTETDKEGKEKTETKYESVSDPKYFWVDVAGSSEYQVKFTNTELTDTDPENRVLTVAYNTSNKTLTPKLYKNGSSTPISSTSSKPVTFTYTSNKTSLVRVTNTGEVRLQDSTQKKTGRAKITVTAEYDGVSVSTYCYIDVVSSLADGVSIDYSNPETKLAMQNGKYVFGYKDNDSSNASVTFSNGDKIVTALDLSATVDSEDKTNDLTRVKWTTENPKVAKFKNSSGSLVNEIFGGDVTLVSTGSGSVRITAELDGKTDTMTVTAWPAYEYDEIVMKPDIPTSISSREDAFNNFAEQYVTVRLTKTDKNVSLPMRNVQYASPSEIQMEGWVDGFDTSNRVAYYPNPEGLDHIESTKSSLADIIIVNQPQDATYKLDATVGTLSIQATPRNGKTMSSFTWYDNNDKAIKTETIADGDGTKTHTSTLKLSDFVTSAGSYGFYCIVRATDNSSVKSRTAIITIGGDYNVKITPSSTSIKPGDKVTLNAVAQQYNPVAKGYTDVTGTSYTVSWSITDGETTAATLSSRTGSSVTLTAKSGGTLTVTAETTIGSNKYTGTQKITITVPTADDVTVMLGDDATYVALDGTKISDAVKSAASAAPTYISFTQPSNGVIYTTSAMSSKVTDGNKYSPSDVSKMVFKPTSNAASYTLEYKAYGSDGQIASGKVLVMTSAGSVVYHISANESQQMLVSDFQSKYGNGLSSVVFGTNSDNRGGLYKGNTTSSGKVGSESYTTSTLKNVYFIAGSTASKYTVTIPYTASGSNGTKYGNLIVYVNDTHSIYSTGASFRSMSIADEIAPENASSNAYATIDSVVGGKLYSAYSSIISNTPLKTSDLGSTKYYFNSSSAGIDSLYVLPIADKTTVEVNYTVYDGSTRTKGTVSFKVIDQKTSQKFTDVKGSTSWAAKSVDFMADSKLVNGITTTTFGPDQTMTRAMLVTILYRAAGQPSVAGITNKFTDLKANEYYVDAVLWAANTGVVTGATATKFDPDGKVTREQIAAILYRYAGSPTGNAASLTGFSDQKNVSAYAVPALQWAVGLGIITGVSTNGRTSLSAKNNATRAQVAVMLHRFLTYDR